MFIKDDFSRNNPQRTNYMVRSRTLLIFEKLDEVKVFVATKKLNALALRCWTEMERCFKTYYYYG